MTRVKTPPRAPHAFTARTVVLVMLTVAATVALVRIAQISGAPTPTRGGVAVGLSFLARAFSPALGYESPVPAGTVPLVWKAAGAAWMTVAFAAAAMSLALAAGVVLTFLASSAWWSGYRLTVAPVVYGSMRVLIAFLRSIHELLWAVLLLAAFGLGHLTAVVAIAIPYSGVLAKVFSEMIDEAPRDAAEAIRDAGASPLQVFLIGLVPRAFPDMTAYAFYRFECALRSSAILGFFGFPTLGYFIAASFENLLYGEVWTYLYVLFALVALADWWSGALRRRLIA